jgi:hypothetical protein
MTAATGEHAPARTTLRDDLRAVLPSWLAARVLVGLAWLLAGAVVSHWVPGGSSPSMHAGLHTWDGAYYLQIARAGYAGSPHDALRFFPLYPLVGRALAFGATGPMAATLVLVANVASLAASVVLRRLVLFERDDPALAERAVWLLNLFPSAFVLVWAYAEALFLLLAIAGFLAARRGRLGWAALFGFAAALTRPVGVLLAPAFLIEAWRRWQSAPDESRGRVLVAGGAATVAPVAGLAAFLAWVGHRFGDALAPLRLQSGLRGTADPVTRLIRAIGDSFGRQRFADGLHTPFLLLLVVLTVLCLRRWPASYGVFAALSILLAVSASNLNSIERYGLDAFPLLLVLAELTSTRLREQVGLAVCACGMLSLCTLAWLSVYVP